VLDTRAPGDPSDYYECGESDEIIVGPGELMLLHTSEYVELPGYVAGLANLRSTYARLGIRIPPCFHPDTLVLDGSGVPVPAKEARALYDPFNYQWSSRKGVFKGATRVVAIFYDDGVPEVVTPHHKFLVYDPRRSPPVSVKRADELRPGDFVAAPRIVRVRGRSSPYDTALALYAGYEFARLHHGERTSVYALEGSMGVGRRIFDELIEKYGSSEVAATAVKRLPRLYTILSNADMFANDDNVRAFFRGIFYGSGGYARDGFALARVTTRSAATKLKLLLLRLGIHTHVVAGRGGYRLVPLSIDDKIRFFTELHIKPRKTYDFKVREVLPPPKTLQEILKVRARMTLREYRFHLRDLTRRKPRGWDNAVKDITTILAYRWWRVKATETIPYDGEVVGWETSSHWHVGSGTISHNTVVDAGFKGQIVIEVVGSAFPVKLYAGDRFLHLVLVRLSSPAQKPYSGNYQGQKGVRLPKIFDSG